MINKKIILISIAVYFVIVFTCLFTMSNAAYSDILLGTLVYFAIIQASLIIRKKDAD